MKKILVAAVALVALTGAATAETITLTSAQLDGVTAGSWWKKDRNNGGVNQSNNNHTSQHSSSGAVSVGGCNVVAFCGGKFSFNGNALAHSSSGNENITFQSNENGGGGKIAVKK